MIRLNDLPVAELVPVRRSADYSWCPNTRWIFLISEWSPQGLLLGDLLKTFIDCLKVGSYKNSH